MPDRPPVGAEDIPQSVVWAAVTGWCGTYGTTHDHARAGIALALVEYERLGYRLVRDDEATVERMAAAAWEATVSGHEGYEDVPVRHQCQWRALSPAARRQQVERMRVALTAAQGGEDQ